MLLELILRFAPYKTSDGGERRICCLLSRLFFFLVEINSVCTKYINKQSRLFKEYIITIIVSIQFMRENECEGRLNCGYTTIVKMMIDSAAPVNLLFHSFLMFIIIIHYLLCTCLFFYFFLFILS